MPPAKGPKGAPKAAEKALAAAKAARVGSRVKKLAKRTKVHFYRPKTKTGGNQDKKYTRAVPKGVKKSEDAHAVIKTPLTSESAMKKIEDNNTLVFLVASTATRTTIARAVEKVRFRGREGGRAGGLRERARFGAWGGGGGARTAGVAAGGGGQGGGGLASWPG